MIINWFPGHMTKSLRMMDENVSLMDFLIYVLDARAPMACINPAFSVYTEKLPVIFVLNKSDLADFKETGKWAERLRSEKKRAVCLDSTRSGNAKPIFALAKELCKDMLAKNIQKGAKRTLRSMVIGVPNCGKSTLINNLCGKARAYAENRAGVTRGKQWVKAGEYFEVLDTPGTLYPKLENQLYARHLAYIGSIKDEILDKYELASLFLDELKVIAPTALNNRYGIGAEVQDNDEILCQIAKKRGFLLAGGVADSDKAAAALLEDFRKGRLGALTLEKCNEND